MMKPAKRTRENVPQWESRTSFLFGVQPDLQVKFDTLLSNTGALEDIAKAFQSNLASAVRLGNIPHQLVQAAVLDQQFSHTLAAERIRQLRTEYSELTEAQKERNALEIAKSKFNELLQNSEYITTCAQETLNRLDLHLSDIDFVESGQELLRQVAVMAWSAFEVLVNDAIQKIADSKPEIGVDLLKSKPYKSVVGFDLLVEALRTNDFKLRDSLGGFLNSLVKLDTLPKILATFESLKVNQNVLQTLGEKRLWLLSQQRHIIVHRRGVVDSDYLKRTGENLTIGNVITFRSDYIEEVLLMIADTGQTIIAACEELLSTSEN